MQSFEGLDPEDSTFKALNLILAAWDEGTECGVPPEQMAYAALFTALTDLVPHFGEDAVVKLARGLEQRINVASSASTARGSNSGALKAARPASIRPRPQAARRTPTAAAP